MSGMKFRIGDGNLESLSSYLIVFRSMFYFSVDCVSLFLFLFLFFCFFIDLATTQFHYYKTFSHDFDGASYLQ